MVNLEEGKSVLVKTLEVQPGPFDDKVVVIKSEPANLSGFVNQRYLVQRQEDWYVQGTIRKISGSSISVSLPGSFFNTAAGVASVTRDWAAANVEEE
jgi:hypothetical protein